MCAVVLLAFSEGLQLDEAFVFPCSVEESNCILLEYFKYPAARGLQLLRSLRRQRCRVRGLGGQGA